MSFCNRSLILTNEDMERETIEKAADEYIHRDNTTGLTRKKSFIDGAQWRINSAWHDASEKYEIRLPSVVVFKNGRAAVYLDLRDVTYDGLWDEVKEYAYLKDLRPDRKEDER